MHPHPNEERIALDPSNQFRTELDGPYTTIPRKGYIAREESKS